METLFDFAVEAARREFRPSSVRDVAVDLFRQLGQSTTAAEARAIADQAGAQGAALIEIATLAERRAQVLALKSTDAFGDAL